MINITVTGGTLEQQEIDAYVRHVQEKVPGHALKTLNIAVDGEEVELRYTYEHKPIERIRRITGYLVGTMERWNDAKTAEERDRVQHSL